MIQLVEAAKRQKTPNEIALTVLLSVLTLIFLIVVATIAPIADYLEARINVADLVALLVALIPTTIGALLSAIGIAGIDRTMRFNVLATSSGFPCILFRHDAGRTKRGHRQHRAGRRADPRH
jgi:K+-transporting ATPase ATPase B chain